MNFTAHKIFYICLLVLLLFAKVFGYVSFNWLEIFIIVGILFGLIDIFSALSDWAMLKDAEDEQSEKYKEYVEKKIRKGKRA